MNSGKQLREKLLKRGIDSLDNSEIIEMLFSLGSPRKDCKPQVKEALERFKTLRQVMEVPYDKLEALGIRKENYFGVMLVQEVARKYLKERIIRKDFLKSSSDVYEYLYHTMRDLKIEVFKVIFLDGQNRILEIEDMFTGSLTSSAIYPREIIKAAIRYDAAGMIFAHSHPSGNPNPSEDDKNITKQLVGAARIMQIKVLDHIIIGDKRFFSFADQGQIEEFYSEGGK